MPIAMEQIDLSAYDVVISNSHAVAKGVIVGPDQLHICYCYTPMRYAWDLQHQYLREQKITGLRGALARWLLHRIRIWDVRTANGVDHFIACSHYIKRRIWRVYRRESTVIYPGVDTRYFEIGSGPKKEYYITASRLVPYKKVGLIVEAFAQMPDRRLIVIGDGPQLKAIAKKATSNIKVLGFQPDSILLEHLQCAKAYIFAAEEDFGISPLEAQACGTPVLAFGKGGACETVIDGKTGLLFGEQSAASIRSCVERFEANSDIFDQIELRRHAELFSVDRFQKAFRLLVEDQWAAHCDKARSVPRQDSIASSVLASHPSESFEPSRRDRVAV